MLRSLLLLLALLLAAPALAHDTGMSALGVQLLADRTEAVLRLSPEDAARAGLPDPASGPLLEVGPFTTEPRYLADADAGLVVAWTFPAFSGGALEIHSRILERLGPDHKQHVRVLARDGSVAGARILTASSGTFRLPIAQRVAFPTRALVFARLGAVHVAEGLDHAAFLLAILLGCTGLRALFASVTAFTSAHSASLALAVSGWVALPAGFVEPCIAASIVLVAVRNLRPGTRTGERLAVVFGFGLVHGLGFAGQLSDLGIGGGADAAAALIGFNLGIEAAQLAAVAAISPPLAALSRIPAWGPAVLRAGSLATAGAGLFWLLERVA